MQLQQVALNLVRNAIDAMAGVKERARVLTVSSKVADGHVSVAITDTGVGIECASTERLFDALYTTKAEGLGLAAIRRHFGRGAGRRQMLEIVARETGRI